MNVFLETPHKTFPLILAVACALLAVDLFLVARHRRLGSAVLSDLMARIAGSNGFIVYAAYIAALQRQETLQTPGPIEFEPLIRRGFVVLVFLIMGASYILRNPARVRAAGFRERLFPFFCAGLPILINESSSHFTPFVAFPAVITDRAATGLLFLGNSVSVWGLFYLRRAFSIMAEVRDLVSRGPYRFVRHPIYAGQILATGALWLLSPTWVGLVLFFVFIAAQHLRASFEEEKLLKALPEYGPYRSRTGAYLPRIGHVPTP